MLLDPKLTFRGSDDPEIDACWKQEFPYSTVVQTEWMSGKFWHNHANTMKLYDALEGEFGPVTEGFMFHSLSQGKVRLCFKTERDAVKAKLMFG